MCPVGVFLLVGTVLKDQTIHMDDREIARECLAARHVALHPPR